MFNPCPGSCGKYIWTFHAHRRTRQLGEIYMRNYNSRLPKNISVQSMSIIEQGSYGKYICSIHAHRMTRQLREIYLLNPCSSYDQVVAGNISGHSMLIVEQGSYGKYICSIHAHRMTRQLREIYMPNCNTRLPKNISDQSMFRYIPRNYLDLLNYNSRLLKVYL